MRSNFDLEQIDEVLSTARSVRRNLDFERPVERAVLYDCIDVAVQAPTGIAGESWRFVVVDAPEQKQAIAVIYRDVLLDLLAERGMPLKPTHKALIERLHVIPAMVFVCVDGEPMNDTRVGESPVLQRLVELFLADELVQPVECVVVTDQQYLADVVSNRRQSGGRSLVDRGLGLIIGRSAGEHDGITVESRHA